MTQWRPAIMPSHRRPSCPVRGDTAPTLSTSPPWSPWSLSILSQLSPVQPDIDLLFVHRYQLSLCGNQSPRTMMRQQKLSCILMRSCTEHAGAAQDSYDQCLAPDCILHCPPYLSSDLGLVAPLSPAPHATAATSGQWTEECCRDKTECLLLL